jgi:hypothetical protein
MMDEGEKSLRELLEALAEACKPIIAQMEAAEREKAARVEMRRQNDPRRDKRGKWRRVRKT